MAVPREARKYDFTLSSISDEQKANITAKLNDEVDSLPYIQVEIEWVLDEESG